MYQSLIIVDDFYPNPDEIRKIALSCDYPEITVKRTFPGRNSSISHIVPGLDRVMSHILSEPAVGSTDPKSLHGFFRITLEGEKGRFGVHVDATSMQWVGVIYLNTPEQCQGGTSLYRHKGLGLDRTPQNQAELEAYGASSILDLLEKEGNDPSKWEHLMTVPMRYNRLVVYRPWMWHAPAEPFGNSLENGRLMQLVCFATQGQT